MSTPDAADSEAAAETDDADLELPEAFAALGISERSLTAVARMGFEEPTPVQARAIPVLLEGRDVVGIAQTGTGKTLAFGIPMAEGLDAEAGDVQGLVLVPTRELAQQVLGVLSDLARPFGMQAIGLLGGHALEGDFRALEQGPQIVVGTPGRIKDHLRRGTLSLRRVRLAVLDEADQMLDIGFLPDITHILGRTPRSRQTALFSATMPHTVTRLIRRYMENPERVAVASDLETVESIEHVYFEVAQRDKVNGLSELIERELRGRTLVFSRTKRGVDFLARELQGRGVNVGALHGDLDQRRRDRMVRRFRNGELDILIATNVAARGIDIPEIHARRQLRRARQRRGVRAPHRPHRPRRTRGQGDHFRQRDGPRPLRRAARDLRGPAPQGAPRPLRLGATRSPMSGEAALPEYVRALLDPATYPHAPREVELRQTHISWVFLAGDLVYKTKKPVDFGFISQLDAETRERFCHAELRLNRRLAPGVYLDVVPVVRTPDGRHAVEGDPASGEVVEHAVKMRRLPDDRTLRRCSARTG